MSLAPIQDGLKRVFNNAEKLLLTDPSIFQIVYSPVASRYQFFSTITIVFDGEAPTISNPSALTIFQFGILAHSQLILFIQHILRP